MRLIIISYNVFSKHLYQLAKQSLKYQEIYFLDDHLQQEDIVDTITNFFLYINDETEFIVGYENDERRYEWLNKLMELGANIASIIAANASIDSSSRVLPGCIIEEDVIIPQNCLIKSGSFIKKGTIIPPNTIYAKGQITLSHLSGH